MGTPKTTDQAIRKARAAGKMAGPVPQIMQMEAVECGAASLGMVLAYYGKWVSLETLRAECGVSRDGSKASNLVKCAMKFGLAAKGRKSDIDDLRNNTVFPCIVHWNFVHFIVVRGFKGNKVYINDPARGETKLTIEEFDKGFTGVSLRFEPTKEFQPGGKPPSAGRYLINQVKRHIPRLALIAVLVAAMSVVQMAMPSLAQSYMELFLEKGWMTTPSLAEYDGDIVFIAFMIIMGVVCLAQILVLIIKQRYTRHTTGRIATQGTAAFMDHALRLPINFYTQRSASDIADRADSNTSVAELTVGQFAPLIIDVFMMIAYLMIMLGYSPLLGTIGLVGALLKVFATRRVAKLRLNSLRSQMRNSILLSTATTAGITSIESLKAAGAEVGYFRKWSGYQAAANRERVNYTKMSATIGLVPSIVSSVLDVAIVVVGIYLVIQGEFAVGSVLAFQGYLSNFMSPLTSLTSALDTFQNAKVSAERLQDVVDNDLDPLAIDMPLPETLTVDKLKGTIDLKHVTFGYSRLEEPLLKDVTIHVEPGESIAFVGPSGCGKSTLVKLISGLYQPWEGEICLDGVPLAEIQRDVRTASVAVIDQDVVLFNDTIAENIRLWDPTITDAEIVAAAKDAQIHDDILARPGSYNGMLTEGGSNMSGGQCQRIDMARALATNPSILLMDEATSALDTLTEANMVRAIQARGITTVMVAHRHSTVRDCTQIIVMNKGDIVQRGTHKELMQDKDGMYYRLVTEG